MVDVVFGYVQWRWLPSVALVLQAALGARMRSRSSLGSTSSAQAAVRSKNTPAITSRPPPAMLPAVYFNPHYTPDIPGMQNLSIETSFTLVTGWPTIKLFTFAECAFKCNEAEEESFKFTGVRMVCDGDPICNMMGQAFGFHHHQMVPVVEPKTYKRRDEHKEDLLDLTKVIFSADAWTQHYIRTYRTLLNQSLTWKIHGSIGERLEFLNQRIIPQIQGSIPENLETYRMALLTELMSYVDANVAKIDKALETLNAQVNPRKPWLPLYQKKLEHVMSFQFFTPARHVSRALNLLGLDRLVYGFNAPIPRQGIANNVHLLRDAENNGYLTFQGTANLGTWLNVHIDYGAYDPDKQEARLNAMLDDPRWESVELRHLRDCHSGLCAAFKSFISNEQFVSLAKKVVNMKSLTIVGHSFGGSMASMFAMSVQGAKDLQKEDSDGWLREFWLDLWAKDFSDA